MSDEKYKNIVIGKQVKLLNRAIKKFEGQTALATALGLRRQQIHRYTTGANEMRWSMYLRILDLIKEKA